MKEEIIISAAATKKKGFFAALGSFMCCSAAPVDRPGKRTMRSMEYLIKDKNIVAYENLIESPHADGSWAGDSEELLKEYLPEGARSDVVKALGGIHDEELKKYFLTHLG